VGSFRMKFSRQTTLGSQATVTGVGVHSGLPVSLTLGPAPVDAGFIFVRTGLDGCDREVQATSESVISTEFATVLGDRQGPLVSTAEHVLAALRGMGVDNATIEIDGPEVPIMDGSASAFVAAIDQAGILTQSAWRRFNRGAQAGAGRDGRFIRRIAPLCGRVPRRDRNRLRQSRDRPSELCARSQPRTIPPRDLPRPDFRMHERCRAALERRICARRLVREFGGVRRYPAAQHRGTALQRRVWRATRFSTLSAISRCPVCRCSAPIARCAAATR